MDDVVLAKAEIIERCQARVAAIYQGDPANLRDDQTKQDAILLNLQRACEAAIDLAMHLVRIHRLGVPAESRAAFALLAQAGLLSPADADALMAMVGFRNVAVHDYRKLDLAIVQAVVEHHLREDIAAFAADAVRRYA